MNNRLNPLFLSLCLICSAIACRAPLSAEAIEVTVRPQKARLGDTFSIVVTPDPGEALSQAPKVNVAGKTFPTFQTGPNRWRAFVSNHALAKTWSPESHRYR